MSDYQVYINNGADDVEYDIPDIYRDADSETNTDQIKTYISNCLNVDYSNLSIDVNRKERLKRKCTNYEVLDGDSLYVYFEKPQSIDFKKLKIKTGFSNMIDLKYNTHNFKETDLKTILSHDDNHQSKINEVLEIIRIKLTSIRDKISQDDYNDITSLNIMSYNLQHSEAFPFNNIDGNYFFCNVDKERNPIGFGYMFDFKTNIYYEGNFNNSNIYHGKCLSLGDDPYYSTCTMYSFGKSVHIGTKKFLIRNEMYTGCFVNGEYGNNGNLVNDEGNYNGIFKFGTKFLFGKMNYKNGDIYIGFWNSGKRSHFGKINYFNGDYFTGTWYDDKKTEFGTYYNREMNVTYIGTFVDDKESFIKDEFTLFKGHYYPSDFFGTYEIELYNQNDDKGNKKIAQKLSKEVYDQGNLLVAHSKEITTFTNCQQTYYVGHYDYTREIFGFGKLYINITGNIIRNSPEGEEIMTKEYLDSKFENFRVYHSNFIESFPNGFCKIDYENGDIYIGSVKNSHLHGHGTLFKNDGSKIKGFWNNNKIIQIIVPLK
jgi:hypothetical protein